MCVCVRVRHLERPFSSIRHQEQQPHWLSQARAPRTDPGRVQGLAPTLFFGNAVPGMQPTESKVLLERPTVAGLESSDERERPMAKELLQGVRASNRAVLQPEWPNRRRNTRAAYRGPRTTRDQRQGHDVSATWQPPGTKRALRASRQGQHVPCMPGTSQAPRADPTVESRNAGTRRAPRAYPTIEGRNVCAGG